MDERGKDGRSKGKSKRKCSTVNLSIYVCFRDDEWARSCDCMGCYIYIIEINMCFIMCEVHLVGQAPKDHEQYFFKVCFIGAS